jgi:uncharacterized OsmC-like protein
MSQGIQTVHLTQVQDYRFDVHFNPDVPVLLADEPAPLGEGLGPSPTQLLAAAVGNCLCASLLFAWRKFKQDPGTLACEVQCEVGRNAEGRMRVLGLQARLTMGVAADKLEHRDRVLGNFESYCTVTESVRQGIPVQVSVFDGLGVQVK